MKAELYKISKYKIILLVLCFLGVDAVMVANREYHIFQVYRNLEPFFAPSLFNMVYGFALGTLAGIMVASDFRNGTVKNIISTGVERKRYYLTRLIGQYIICLFVFLYSVIFYVVLRQFLGQSYGWRLLWNQYILKLLVFMLVVFVQLLAYESIYTVVAFLIRNTIVSVAICLAITYVEAILTYMLRTVSIGWFHDFVGYLPGNVLQSLGVYIQQDSILSKEFILKIVSGFVIMAVSTGIGIISFLKRDVR